MPLKMIVQQFLYYFIMPQRKVWTEDQDKILRLLRQERGERKWANIARIMEQEFDLPGRTGKQCRQRYHNHLDSAIVSSEWTAEEEQVLYEMHQQIGNKWSLIAQKLPGRSDNCVKNHFYSKLRKSLRRLNKLIHDYFSTQFSKIKQSVMSKIIKTTESKFKTSSKIDQELADFCNNIKNRLYSFSLQEEEGEAHEDDLEMAKQLLSDIQVFDRDYKKGYKGIKLDYDVDYLKPPPNSIKKKSSSSSWESERSQSNSSFLSSSFGSESDLSDLDAGSEQHNKKSKSTEGISGLSSRNSGRNTVKSQEIKGQGWKEKRRDNSCFQYQNEQQMQLLHLVQTPQSQGSMKIESFALRCDNLIERDLYDQSQDENIHFHGMYYDNTPVIARIMGPSDLESLDLFKDNNEENDIQFKMDNMEL